MLQGKRILVTGGSGFLGSHLVDALRDVLRDALRDNNGPSLVVPRSSQFDLTDARDAQRLFDEVRPEVVFHLAARVGGIGANQAHPGSFFRDNMLMGVHVLEQSRRCNVEKVIVVGTVCSYPKHTPVPFSESSLWDGYPEETNAPYGVAKRALLVMAQAYRQEFGCHCVVVLPANLYGPRDNFDLNSSHVVAAMIRKFEQARQQRDAAVTLWGDGSATRDLFFVRDAARALILAAEKYDAPEPVNIGTGQEVSIRTLAELVAQRVGFAGEIVWDTSRPNGQPRRVLNTERAEQCFGFRAETPLVDGLAETIEWYRSKHSQG